MKRPTINPKRIRSFDCLSNCLMVTSYQAERPGEVGHVGYVPIVPRTRGGKPGGSAMR